MVRRGARYAICVLAFAGAPACFGIGGDDAEDFDGGQLVATGPSCPYGFPVYDTDAEAGSILIGVSGACYQCLSGPELSGVLGASGVLGEFSSPSGFWSCFCA